MSPSKGFLAKEPKTRQRKSKILGLSICMHASLGSVAREKPCQCLLTPVFSNKPVLKVPLLSGPVHPRPMLRFKRSRTSLFGLDQGVRRGQAFGCSLLFVWGVRPPLSRLAKLQGATQSSQITSWCGNLADFALKPTIPGLGSCERRRESPRHARIRSRSCVVPRAVVRSPGIHPNWARV